jgi:hypothetical protein
MWTSAMSMYRQLEQWEDAKRVAKVGVLWISPAMTGEECGLIKWL